ncbi:hypothetical protein MAR_009152, partial [Mya arenaria]
QNLKQDVLDFRKCHALYQTRTQQPCTDQLVPSAEDKDSIAWKHEYILMLLSSYEDPKDLLSNSAVKSTNYTETVNSENSTKTATSSQVPPKRTINCEGEEPCKKKTKKNKVNHLHGSKALLRNKSVSGRELMLSSYAWLRQQGRGMTF